MGYFIVNSLKDLILNKQKAQILVVSFGLYQLAVVTCKAEFNLNQLSGSENLFLIRSIYIDVYFLLKYTLPYLSVIILQRNIFCKDTPSMYLLEVFSHVWSKRVPKCK